MKLTCTICKTRPEDEDKYCAECGMMLFDLRYGTGQVTEVGDLVIRMSRRGIGFKAARGIVSIIWPDGTVSVKWSHRKAMEYMSADDLCLSFKRNSEGKLVA